MRRAGCVLALLLGCAGSSVPPEATGDVPVAPAPPPAVEAETPEGVVAAYFAALDRGDLDAAWAMWAAEGGPGGSRAAFDARHAGRSYAVEVGVPGRPEGAAGSVYVTVPVGVTETADGVALRREGQVIVRRSTVDGATEAQRAWHLYRVELGG